MYCSSSPHHRRPFVVTSLVVAVPFLLTTSPSSSWSSCRCCVVVVVVATSSLSHPRHRRAVAALFSLSHPSLLSRRRWLLLLRPPYHRIHVHVLAVLAFVSSASCLCRFGSPTLRSCGDKCHVEQAVGLVDGWGTWRLWVEVKRAVGTRSSPPQVVRVWSRTRRCHRGVVDGPAPSTTLHRRRRVAVAVRIVVV